MLSGKDTVILFYLAPPFESFVLLTLEKVIGVIQERVPLHAKLRFFVLTYKVLITDIILCHDKTINDGAVEREHLNI